MTFVLLEEAKFGRELLLIKLPCKRPWRNFSNTLRLVKRKRYFELWVPTVLFRLVTKFNNIRKCSWTLWHICIFKLTVWGVVWFRAKQISSVPDNFQTTYWKGKSNLSIRLQSYPETYFVLGVKALARHVLCWQGSVLRQFRENLQSWA